jgi:hypothetical protein
MILKIVSIDHNGYNGREHHPEDIHIGLHVSVIGVHVESLFGITDPEQLKEIGAGQVRRFEEQTPDEDDHESVVLCYTGVTKDSTLLELMEHEVRVVKFLEAS